MRTIRWTTALVGLAVLLSTAAPAAATPGPAATVRAATDAADVHAFGDAPFLGSTGNLALQRPVVAIAADPDGHGYWTTATDGGVFSFSADFHGSTGGMRLNQPIVGLTPHQSGDGYWFVAADGGVFAFDVPFHGSTGGITLNQPIVGMAATPTGGGYWLVARDGGIFAFGDAAFEGSTGDLVLNQPIVGMASTSTGGGYWFVAADGGIFAFGDAGFHGSADLPEGQTVVGMAATTTGDGYWLAARREDGVVLAAQGLGVADFGDAGHEVERALEDELGAPTWRSAWSPEHCPAGGGGRLVAWGRLVVLLAGPSGGSGTFVAYDYAEGVLETAAGEEVELTGGADLRTSDGVGLGTPGAEVRRVYGAAAEYVPGDADWWSGYDVALSSGSLWLTLADDHPDAEVAGVAAGASCEG